ncbi:MAG: hypothetical protein IH623_27155 [Verrucomicrobia bacterium]|nr:hypothetical protein [Verrucomicrobiota bacterium]
MVAHLIAQRFGEELQIKAADVVPPQPALHGTGMADIGQRAGDDDAIPAAKDADDLVGVALSQQFDLRRLGSSRCRFRNAA